jgi:hypothetical protein
MKQSTLTVLALGAALVLSSHALAQTKSGQTAAPAPAAQQQQIKLARVVTLNGIDVNRDFQNNVQILQAQRQAVIELNATMEQEKDSKKKAELKKQVDEALAKLNENNEKMAKAYGFSLARNYTMVVETAHIYTFVTDEEAAQFEKAEAEKKAEEKKNPTSKKK